HPSQGNLRTFALVTGSAVISQEVAEAASRCHLR
ncbi:MAG: hypothetical protein QOJ98_54, partial [Acidobacteriota bacterium]|nr:hypothetical protein [Acidobacteriota bacterium]